MARENEEEFLDDDDLEEEGLGDDEQELLDAVNEDEYVDLDAEDEDIEAGTGKQATAEDDESQLLGTNANSQNAAAKGGQEAANGGQQQPEWKPVTIRANRQDFSPIEGMVAQERGDFMIVAVPKAQYSKHQALISRGLVSEQLSRENSRLSQELESATKAERPPTTQEIEAQVFLEAMEEIIPRIFSPADIEFLKLKAKDAHREATDAFNTKLTEQKTARDNEGMAEQKSLQGLGAAVYAVLDDFPADHPARKLTDTQLREFFRDELAPVARSLVTIEGDNWSLTPRQQEYLTNRLSRLAQGQGGNGAGTQQRQDGGSKADRLNRDSAKAGQQQQQRQRQGEQPRKRNGRFKSGKKRGNPRQVKRDMNRRLNRWVNSSKLTMDDEE